MQNVSYNKIKEYIKNKLENTDGALPKGKIDEEINDSMKWINALEPQMLNLIFGCNDFEKISEDDWVLLKRELETMFDVQVETGTLIQGVDQQKRDTTWWTDKVKLKSENYYWNRYEKYMKKSLPYKAIQAIDIDTDHIMNNLSNPDEEEFSTYGMVVGHVQSGKTGNYSGLICKAADAGYKFIVVIAGAMNNLRNQTQDRLNHAFIGKDGGNFVGVGKLAGYKKAYMPSSLTTKDQDFNKKDADRNSQSSNFDVLKSPVILVIKKNGSTFKNVIKWLTEQYKNKIADHAMLLIDDESDYASVNTKNQEDPAVINKRIRELLGLFKKSTYVAYTATPYANIFIDHSINNDDLGKDLFPKDFIYALEAPSNYFGARKIFLDTEFKHIITIQEPKNLKLNHKKDASITYLPDSLKDAMRLFIINVAIRKLLRQGDKHNSMLIHASRFTMVHQKIAKCVEDYLIKLRKDIVAYGMLDNPEYQSENIADIKETFEKRCDVKKYNWSQVIKSITEIIETVIIREVHQDTGRGGELVYSSNGPTNVIVIGGTSLSRGYTLEGLSVTYFLRKTVFYDTLMQMGRWFGYRMGYENLCKIYMTKEMRDNFKLIIEATEELFEDFRIMEREKRTPEDFGLAVKQHPDSGLQVTARNKQKNSEDIYYEMKLDGSLKETRWIPMDNNLNNKNIDLIRKTICEVNSQYDYDKQIKNSYLWKNIDSDIVKEFVDKFNIYNSEDEESDLFGMKSRMPVNFIRKYIDQVDTKWDIAVYSGESNNFNINEQLQIKKENRQVEIKDNNYYEVKNRQVSSGNAEAISLSDDELNGINKSKRKEVRALLKRPLLMLHILDTNENHELAAFGISFPGSIISKGKTVKLKINTVYIEKLLKGEEYDD